MLRTHNTEAANEIRRNLLTINYLLLFSEFTLSLTGEKISTTNANFAQKSFTESEFSYGYGANKTELACQSFYYEENPSAIDGIGELMMLRSTKFLMVVSKELKLFGKITCDFWSCDTHLPRGVAIRLSLRLSPNGFVVTISDAAEQYKFHIIEANLYVRKMTLANYVLSYR